MTNIQNISLIIPHKNQYQKLLQLLLCIENWLLKPKEIIIIDSSNIEVLIPNNILLYFAKLNIELRVFRLNHAFPGAARNIGVEKCIYDIIAFLDVGTLPDNKWLENGINTIVNNSEVICIWGKTQYIAESRFANIIKYATYGENPLITIPGTIIRRKAMLILGNFIGSTRAGEDADWMARAKIHKIYALNSETIQTYEGLNDIDFLKLIKKWYRNYYSASQLPYLNGHILIYYTPLLFLLLSVAFNWNWLIANWDENNLFYLPYVTRLLITLLVLIYILIRGIFLPIKKGVALKNIFPFNWFFICLFSLILDFIKIYAFAKGVFKYKYSTTHNLDSSSTKCNFD